MKVESGKWRVIRIGDCCQLLNGRAFKPSEWGKQGLPIVRIQNLNSPEKPFNYYDGSVDARNLIDSGDVLLSWSGTPGTSFGCFLWTKGKAVLNQHIFKVIVDRDTIDKMFFIHSVNNILETIIFEAHGGVGLRHITKGKLEAIKLSLPPLPEQKRIVARIQECMEKVQEIERLRVEAEKEADNLLPSLIDASMAQASGKEVSLEDVCSIVSRLVDPKEKKHQSLLHVGGANIESKTSRLIDLQTAAQEKITSGKFLFDDTMVLYNKIRPYLMKVARPDFSGLCSADMYPLKPTGDLISKDYLFYLLMSRHFTDYAIMGSNRAGMPKVNREHLFAYRFILPSRNVQDEITTKLNHGFAASNQLIRHLQESSSETVAIRESILRKAFAGEL